MKKLIFAVYFMCISFVGAQINFETGTIIESVSLTDDTSESFALYLPNNYNPNVLNAIVFIFDPSGIGKYGINTFIPASEKYNFILVCSNDSKNGPYQKNFDIANRLFESIFSTFNIDQNQIYVAGFSGGSRFATAIAVLTEQMQAVIACGSGFPDNINFAPVSPVFSYSGIVGNRDMNYNEMRNNKVYLDKLGFTNSLFVFEGDHQWPPSETILEVFDWLQILAIKKGLRLREGANIETIFNDMYDRAIMSTNIIYKELMLKRIAESFATLMNTDSIVKMDLAIKNSKPFKTAISELEQIFKEEDQLIEKFIPRFYQNYKEPKESDMRWWNKEISELHKIAKIDKGHSDMIDRFTYKLLELVYTRSNPDYFPVTKEQQNFCNKILSALKKKYDLTYIY